MRCCEAPEDQTVTQATASTSVLPGGRSCLTSCRAGSRAGSAGWIPTAGQGVRARPAAGPGRLGGRRRGLRRRPRAAGRVRGQRHRLRAGGRRRRAALDHRGALPDRAAPLCVIPEGAGTVNGSCKVVVWVSSGSFVVGGRPSTRRRDQWWSARSAARTNDIGAVKG
jgi:hypothetical protein